MEASLSSLNVWFSSHALKVNATKTQLMVFGSRQNLRNLPDFKISFRDTELQPCAQVGNLGVVFEGTLSWEAHVSELSRRCMGVLIGLSHARQCLPDGVLKTIVTTLVISRVQYFLTVYGNGSQKNFDRLQKILNFAARVIFGRRKFDHASDLRDLLGWMPPKFMAEIHPHNGAEGDQTRRTGSTGLLLYQQQRCARSVHPAGPPFPPTTPTS